MGLLGLLRRRRGLGRGLLGFLGRLRLRTLRPLVAVQLLALEQRVHARLVVVDRLLVDRFLVLFLDAVERFLSLVEEDQLLRLVDRYGIRAT